MEKENGGNVKILKSPKILNSQFKHKKFYIKIYT